MHFSTIALALNFGSAALAFPALFKRQDDAVSTVESIVVSTTEAVITPSQTEESPFPEASASGSADVDYSDYPCPEGYLLTYQEAQRTYDVSYITLRDAGLMAGSFSNAPQYESPEGEVMNTENMTDEAGTTRSRSSDLFEDDIEETLVETEVSEEAYQAVSNLTSVLNAAEGDLTVTNWTYVYQAYSNDTAAGEEASTIKIFANACASDQEAARAAMAQLFQNSFDTIATRVDSEDAAFTATQTFVATVAPPVVTDTAFATRTEQETNTEISTDTLVNVQTETDTEVEISTNTETNTETLVNPTTATEEATVTQTATDTSVLVNTDSVTQTEQVTATVTEETTATQTPDIDQVTSQVVVPSVVATTGGVA